MKLNLVLSLIKRFFCLLTVLLALSGAAIAQTFPTATAQASDMTIGWNIGNSMEVPDGETAWGNPLVSQTLIDAVKAAGFNTVRIPCAWSNWADATTYVIQTSRLARIKEVVDYCMNNDMYVIINIHWDGGWLEEHPTYDYQTANNAKQKAFWTQIANYFKSYDEHLLFAGTNEVHADYGTPTTEHIAVQQSYNQTFVDAVRATGGNNTNRNLIVQFYNTNMWHGVNYFTAPTDAVEDHLFVEAHYYDPYDFTLNTTNSSACILWGSPYASGDVCSWGQESYVEDIFAQVKTKFVDQGYPVILGEYGVVKRTSLTGTDYTQHIASRLYYLEYITDAAVRSGMIPIYWDNGYNGDMGFALFNRTTGAVVDQDALDALMEGAGIGNPNATYTLSTSVSGSGTISLSPSGGTYSGGTSVTVTATAGSGYSFLGWSGDLSGSTNPTTITMSGNKSITAIFVAQGTGGSGTILREYWTNISGTIISSLTSNSNYPNTPTGSTQLTSLEGPVNWADNYGTRIRGYLHVPSTGSYTFWVAGDDYTNLYLSSDETAANATRIAYVEGYTNSREWTKYTSQTATVTLTGGKKYYIEVLHKEASGGDNVAVAWQGPGITQAVIDGAFLSPYVTSTTNYTLTTATTGTGTITLSPSGGTYAAGTVVTVTATPGSGYTFSSWSGDLSGSTNPTTITMDGNKSITANFTQSTTNYTLTTATSGTGSVTLSPSGGTYAAGTVVTVTATAGSGYTFSSWSGDLSGSTNPTTITMNSNKSITANFTQTGTSYTLTITVSGSGTVSASPSGGTYPSGTVVTLTATAGSGYTFSGWGGSLSGTTNPVTLTMNSSKVVTASFTLITGDICDSPTGKTVPFSYSGAGEYCWKVTQAMAYVNSWCTEKVTINDVDYTNIWSSTMPAAIDGAWYIYYKGSYDWSHFEAPSLKSASGSEMSQNNSGIKVYPNPFTETVNLVIDNPELVKSIVILDQLGRQLTAIDRSDIAAEMELGQNLDAGIYFIQVYDNNGAQNFTINKTR